MLKGEFRNLLRVLFSSNQQLSETLASSTFSSSTHFNLLKFNHFYVMVSNKVFLVKSRYVNFCFEFFLIFIPLKSNSFKSSKILFHLMI